ncbi:MAG: glycosyltransferase family 2 protein [Pseudomonadaceae bacterium]|nr:glycosyltransferase family 2 protein [Pseudomonadaceae bacterium]
MEKKTDISVVVPLYNEEDNVARLVEAVARVMRPYAKAHKIAWELVAVDDGSRDATAAKLAQLAKKHPELMPVYFRRNFGQTAAMQAGFDHARGAVVVTIDGDLQNDPADIPAMLAEMEKTGADIVSGWRKKRKDHALWRNFPSKIANRLIGKVTGVRIHDYGCSLKAYKAEVLEDLHIYGELHRFIPAIAAQGGAKVVEMEVSHHARQFGASKYGIDRTFRVVLDLLQVFFFQKFLHRPLHAFGYAGMVSFLSGFVGGVYLTAIKLTGASIGGRPLLLLSVMLMIMGVQLVGMGLLGELLVRIYHEPKGRKVYRVKTK